MVHRDAGVADLPGDSEDFRGDVSAVNIDGQGAYLTSTFLNASQDPEPVKGDIAAWYPLVKLGGIFAGHGLPAERVVL